MARRSVLFGDVMVASFKVLLSLERSSRKVLMHDLKVWSLSLALLEIMSRRTFFLPELFERSRLQSAKSDMARTSHFDSECLIRTDMGALLVASSFYEAFRIQIGLATALGMHPPKRKS